MPETGRGINARLLAAHPPVIRPQDATWWKTPRKQLARLAKVGVVATPAHGVYVVVPPARLGDAAWRPTLEGFALALAQRLAGADRVALMAISAARIHGALPRAVEIAVVAGTQRARPLRTAWGDVLFVRRPVDGLDLQRTSTDLTEGWVTTVEQTILDVADRPHVGDLDDQTSSEVLIALAARADWQLVANLAQRQRRRAAFARARWVADAVVEPGTPRPALPRHKDRYADSLGLRPAGEASAEQFGVKSPDGTP